MKLHPLRNTEGINNAPDTIGTQDVIKTSGAIRHQAFGYTTFGCMWKRGECTADTEYVCRDSQGKEVPMQSRITAYWPDGTVKWTAHTADAALLGEEIEVLPGKPADFEGMWCVETEDKILLDAGAVTVHVPKDGRHLFTSAERDGRVYLCDAEAVLLLEEPVEIAGNPARMQKSYVSCIESVTVEETGPLRTILRYEGIHVSAGGERKLPFIIRMEAGYNNPDLKFTHTFLYDGDEDKDFLKGLGIRFQAPMAGEVFNRHVKFTGDHGVFHEALVPMTSWRPRLSGELYRRQFTGEKLVLNPEEREAVDKVLEAVPVWSRYELYQDSVSHFGIKKKLAGENLCYIDALHGNHTAGGGAFGSEYGSVTVAVRDFWEKYPSGLTFQGLDSDRAECTLWFYSPEAAAFDFRHYATRGYNQVCYEGYDFKGASPDGIACTNECAVTFSEALIPTDEEVEAFAAQVNTPVVYVGSPQFYHDMRAFGYWSLPAENGTEVERWLEGQLEQVFDFYKGEIGQRNWYGMFNYGDVMHTYDAVRHQWKYDIGGYAWDNTELVPTLWLWLYFMRTGREDVYRVAEKLSRHASEVDVYHMGQYKGLGSRHNVRHWGCPCKEARIAMAGHHRYMYYLTGDRRLEDIFEELKDNELSFLNKDPLGEFYDKKDMVYPSHARSGPDWSSLCSNWMTRWERFNDTVYLDKIKIGIEDIKKTPMKLVSGPDFEFDPGTCHLRYIGERTTGGCHLQICMGAPQIWTELGDLLGDEEWNAMVADLGRMYFTPREEMTPEQRELLGKREFTYPFMGSGIGAYGAAYLKDDKLAERVWRELLKSIVSENNFEGFACTWTADCGNRESLREIPWVSTNFVAQFCLNVIFAMEFIRDRMPGTFAEVTELVGADNGNFRKA